MESKKQSELKIEKNVKVKVSKNGKWISHILPGQGIMVTFAMKYYRSILNAHPENNSFDESTLSDEQKIFMRVNTLKADIKSFNAWLMRNKIDYREFVLGQIAENFDFVDVTCDSPPLGTLSENLNQAVDTCKMVYEE